MNWTDILVDALWIVVLSLMSSASLGASKRVPKGLAMPMLGLPLPRALALCLLPGVSLAGGLALMAAGHTLDGENALIVLGLRLALPPLLAVLHLSWLRGAIKRLQDEGRIQG